jgi:D-alanyl-D-alanine carboxypeptidase
MNKRIRWVIAVPILALCLGLAFWKGGKHLRRAAYRPVSIHAPADVILVNEANPLPDDFSPGEIVNLYEQKRHFLLANSEIELEKGTFEAADRMFQAAEEENLNDFILTSGYRTRERQAELYGQSPEGVAQQPGCSEHETGLAFDVTTRHDTGTLEETPQIQWLFEHCWDYGFILRYPKGKEDITGITYECWHYRYVGEKLARIIHEHGWTLEEYCMQQERQE